MGYRRGIQPEIRYGASMSRLSNEAFLERQHQAPSVIDITRRKSRYRSGLDVTGYTGFIPGKYAGNVFGKTFSNANYASQKFKRNQSTEDPMLHDAYVEKVLREFEKIAPSSTHGNYPLYSGTRSRSNQPRASD